jgi:hypothetical protein
MRGWMDGSRRIPPDFKASNPFAFIEYLDQTDTGSFNSLVKTESQHLSSAYPCSITLSAYLCHTQGVKINVQECVGSLDMLAWLCQSPDVGKWSGIPSEMIMGLKGCN